VRTDTQSRPIGSEPGRFVIPPGQEAVIARMLNPPAGLAGGWRFERATIRSDAIHGHYRGPNGARARVILEAAADAPPRWPRTERFAVGLAAEAPGADAVALYRTVLAAVRAAEAAFAWRETGGATAPRIDLDAAERGRAAEPEIDLHLDLTPFVDLGVEFDHRGAFAEALALADRFVAYQSNPTYGVTGWRGLALQALDGDPGRAATTEEDAGVYQDQSRYRPTEIAALCPITMALLERLLDFGHCRTVAFLMLLPGARIVPHMDGVGPPVMRSLNVALNMPPGCRLVIDCNPDGSDNPYTRTAPFRAGSVLLLNVAKHHYVVNESDVPRIHVVARGALRLPATRVLALAEAQDGLRGKAAVEAALAEKRSVLDGPSRAAEATSPPAPVLSPYVSALAAAAGDRLAALFGAGEEVLSARIGSAADGSEHWLGEVELRAPSGGTIRLDFRPAAAAREAWFRTANLACSYRAGAVDPLADGRDEAFLAAVRRRLGEIDAPPPATATPELRAFLAALERYQPFLAVKDEDYRIVFRGADPPVGILWLGFRCNQDCRTCWQGRDWPAPPDDVFDRWLEELCAAGIGSLTLSGGEPTLHPRLPHWLRQAARAGVHVTLESNAIRLGEDGVLDELRAAGLESVVVSLHAADAAVSDAVTRAPGTFALTVAGTRAALAAGLRVGVHCVVERGNVEGLEAHARFVAEGLGGERRVAQVSYSFPIAYRRRELYRDAIAPLDQVRPHLSAAVRVLSGAGIEVRFLGPSGFTPCAFDDAASLAPLLPAALGEEMRSERTFVEPCARCSLRARCLGVHKEYAARHGGRGVEPVS
jgi:pyruvate-formate lyase-activating enzyme